MTTEISEQDLAFMWECQPSGIFNSDNAGESKAKSAMGPPKTSSAEDEQKEQKTEGEALVECRKRGRAGEDKMRKKRGGKGKGRLSESDHEIHIRTEKERRKKMRELFKSLHDLLPHLSPKADKAAIVDEAVYYIESQQRKLQELQQLKLERLQSVAMPTFGCQASALNSQWQPYYSSEEPITNQGFPSNLADNITNPNPYNSTEPLIADHNGFCNNLADDITNPNPYNSTEALIADHNGFCNNLAVDITNPNPYNSMEALLADHNESPSNFAGAITNPNPPGPVVFETYSCPNVVLNICGNDATINVCSPKKEGLMTTICFVLEKYPIEVLSAHISSDANRSVYMFQTQAKKASNLFPNAFPMEEIFKQAAREINYAITMSI